MGKKLGMIFSSVIHQNVTPAAAGLSVTVGAWASHNGKARTAGEWQVYWAGLRRRRAVPSEMESE
jgi:hypothetical protein